jgi:acyl-phosphate glycerol 3-phosphate acyltransferase
VTVLVILAAYLIGAIPFGYLVARLRGVDILHEGSGNIGATNVGRVLGRRFGLLVFVLDFAKGAVPAALGGWARPASAADDASPLGPQGLAVAAGLAAFLGHLYPIYLRFRGGKGVATGAGVVAVLLPGPALGALLTWLAVLCATRYVSLASLAAAAALVLFHLALSPHPLDGSQRTLTLFCVVAAGLIVLRHRANLERLWHGNENRLPENPAMLLLSKTLHVLALGLWFGTGVFFLMATLAIFHTFEDLGRPDADRPAWLPLPAEFDKEMGTRLAGVAVAPLFDRYYPLQVICGLLAAATAYSWSRAPSRQKADSIRALVLALALVTVLAGWPLGRHVGQLRVERYSTDPALAAAAKAAFGSWHTYSLLLNFVTLILVTWGMALAAQLPPSPSEKTV